MKLTKRILALLLAFTMVFAIAACGTEEGNGGGTGTTAAPGDSNGTNGNGGTPVELPEAEEFDFALVAFNNRDFVIPMASNINIGGNLDGQGGGADDAVQIFGFKGFPRPTCYDNDEGCEDEDCEECGYDCDYDPDGEWITLVSQNGSIWDNIARIEASFFLSGEAEEPGDLIANVEWFIQGGLLPLGGPHWRNPGVNLMEQVTDPEDDDDPFEWGEVMDVVWDFTWFKNDIGIGDAFASPPEDINADNDNDPDYQGGGINKFGLMVQNDDVLNDTYARINWTDVVIYVYDIELFMEQVAEVIEETDGLVSMSDNVENDLANRVRQA